MSVHYMTPETFVAYRILSVGVKCLPYQSVEEVQMFVRGLCKQMRANGEPVQKGKEIAQAALNAVKSDGDEPEVRAYKALQNVRKSAWAQYRSANPVREVRQR